MKTRIVGTFLMSAALMLGASRSDAAIGDDLHRNIVAYGHYTVFDNVAYRVTNGQVHLTGVVSDASKKTAIDKLAHNIKGVTAVNDDIQPLSGSLIDNQLRAKVAAAIYGNPTFDHYASEHQQPVRIIVDHGSVTLQGTVQSQREKDVAEANAKSAGLRNGPVVDKLRIVAAGRKS